MKNLYKHLFIMISCIIYYENIYTGGSYTNRLMQKQLEIQPSSTLNTTKNIDEQNVDFNCSSISAMQYFNENMKKNQTTYKNIQNLMLGAPINSIESIINQSKLTLTDSNKQMIQDALTSTLRALSSSITDAKFDADENATISSCLNPINYIYVDTIEKELINMKELVQHRLNEDNLINPPQKVMKYTYSSAKLATGVAILIAAIYAGINYNKTKDSLYDVACGAYAGLQYNKTKSALYDIVSNVARSKNFSDIFTKSTEAIKPTVSSVVQAVAQSPVSSAAKMTWLSEV